MRMCNNDAHVFDEQRIKHSLMRMCNNDAHVFDGRPATELQLLKCDVKTLHARIKNLTMMMAMMTMTMTILGVSLGQIRSSWVQKSALGESWSPRAPTSSQEPLQTQQTGALSPPPGSVLEGFGSHVGLQEPLKGHSKCIQNFDRCRYPFFIDFASILEAFWEGLGSHLGLQDAL